MESITIIALISIVGFTMISQAEKYYKKTKKRINGVDSHLDSLHRHLDTISKKHSKQIKKLSLQLQALEKKNHRKKPTKVKGFLKITTPEKNSAKPFYALGLGVKYFKF